MYQHPVPQNVTGYQFRLIGDMTIKQFMLLASGIGAAVFFYLTNLFAPIKWALIFGSGLFGVALAFFPIEERPLDQWIVAYFKAIYQPTHFIWQKLSKVPDYFSFTASSRPLPQDSAEIAEIMAQRKKQGIQSYLATLPEGQTLTQLETQESAQISQLLNLFSQTSATPTTTQGQLNISAVTPTPTAQVLAPSPLPTTEVSTTPQPLKTSVGVAPTNAVRITPEKPAAPKKPQVVYQSPQESAPAIPSQTLDPVIAKTNAGVVAQTSATLPFPTKPTIPNVVVGMVLGSEGKILENAIIEIRDASGLPVRATKTNRLGQFFSATPLANGRYEISIEKDNYSFDILKLELSGKIIDPLKIQAKS